MPITKSGKKVLASMKKQYGEKKGEEVFNASIVKGKKGSEKWHGKGSGKLAKAKRTYAKKHGKKNKKEVVRNRYGRKV
jgi:hypothetical protein